MVFVADALAGWLVGQLADAGRKKLTSLVLGDAQDCSFAAPAGTLPGGGLRAGHVATAQAGNQAMPAEGITLGEKDGQRERTLGRSARQRGRLRCRWRRDG